MESSTAKLPKGRSYPLKPSALSRAINSSNLETPVQLMRWDRSERILRATFYPAGSWPYSEGDIFLITCGAVSSDRAAEARAVVEAEAIPQFIEWAQGIERLDEFSTVRREKPEFRFSLERFAT